MRGKRSSLWQEGRKTSVSSECTRSFEELKPIEKNRAATTQKV